MRQSKFTDRASWIDLLQRSGVLLSPYLLDGGVCWLDYTDLWGMNGRNEHGIGICVE